MVKRFQSLVMYILNGFVYGGTCLWTPWCQPDYQGVLIFQVILCTKGLGPQLSVWIIQVYSFSSVQIRINRFHCVYGMQKLLHMWTILQCAKEPLMWTLLEDEDTSILS